jgi:hypothetical protein
MDFLKKHYEKILLGVVLLGLVAGAVFLTIMIPAERAKLDEQSKNIINRPPKPLPPLDLTVPEQQFKELQANVVIDLAANHKVFNPMLWRKRPPENTPIKEVPRNVGPQAITVTRIVPLHLTITFDSVIPSDAGASGARYVMGVEREAAATAAARRKKPYNPTLNSKNDVFILREVKGPADNPTEVVVELNDTTERVSVFKDKPYKRVDGYLADLKYTPDNKTWLNQRNGGQVRIENEDYNIVVIRKDEVILSAKLNDKKTTIPYTAAP